MPKPVIILVEPQMGENIGAAARAMANFEIPELRIVNPRDGWPNPKAEEMSAGGIDIIKKAKTFGDIKEAIDDITYLIATSARTRDLEKSNLSPRECIDEASQQENVGIMFGRENNGLTNEELVMADTLVSIPTSKEYPSINIAQSVNIICYEWFIKTHIKLATKQIERAAKGEVINFFEHLEEELDKTNFFQVPEKRQKMILNIRNMINRTNLTKQETQTLHGIVKSLSKNNS